MKKLSVTIQDSVSKKTVSVKVTNYYDSNIDRLLDMRKMIDSVSKEVNIMISEYNNFWGK